MKQRLSLLLAALWWGSLTALGFVVVPMLFAHLGSAAAAGTVAINAPVDPAISIHAERRGINAGGKRSANTL